MASAKKKQDEKNLKTLRELVSQPGNKECFDCQQRGPTYVNMTIGSFVCTTCSGLLRGLTPPHRVKSISMATFTQEEIDFLRERGNDFCRAIWLGLMPQSATHTGGHKDEQKMKDFMSAKYELKRYYLDPAMASQLLVSSQKQNGTSKQQQHHQPQVGKSSSSNGVSSSSVHATTVPAPLVKAPPSKSSSTSVQLRSSKESTTRTPTTSPEVISSSTSDFVADFSKAPVTAPSPLIIPPVNKYSQPITTQPSFANFENNPIFDSSKANNQTGTLTPVSKNANANRNGTITNNTPPPPPEDRYAALKDLDSMMKQASLKEDNLLNKSNSWNIRDVNNAANNSNTWAAFDQTSSPIIANPFSGQSWWPSVNILNNNLNGTNNNNNNFQPFENNVSNTANPFRQTQIPLFNNDSCWFGQDTQNVENISSSHLSPLSNKSWQPTVTGFRANPFAVGSGIENTTRNSNNPFL